MAGSPSPSEDPGNQKFHRAVLGRSNDLVIVADADGRLIYISGAIRPMLGHEPTDLVGASILDLVHPDDVPDQEARLGDLRGTPGRVVTSEFRARHREGGWRMLQAISVNLLDDPVIQGILIELRDLTELHAAQSELERARELLGKVVSHAPVVLWKVDADGTFELSEGRGLEALGLEPGQVVGANVFDVYADDAVAADLMRRALAGEDVETRAEVAGRVFDFRVRPVLDDDGVAGAVGVAFDVTEAAREAERSAFQAGLLERVGAAVIVTDPAGRVIYWNQRAEEMYGWSRREALGSSIMDLIVPEPQTGSAEALMEQLRAGHRWSGEFTVRRKDGSEFPAHVADVPLLQDGELVAVIGTSTDLTEQKRLEANLARAQRMDTVAALAGGIAHDFNNLLTTIGGYAALAADRARDDQVSADLREVMHATDRARGLAGKLLAFSPGHASSLEPVELNAALRTALPMLRRVAGDRVRLAVELSERPWRVLADPGLIEQALLGLTLNAREAMPDGGTVTFTTDRVTLGAARIRALDLDVEPGDYVRLTIADQGTGIDPELLDRIFEPFFTTKERGEGQGLGLSLVFGTVRQAGGDIVVESDPGAGTRFSLYLSRLQTDEVHVQSGAGEPLVSEKPPTVLVVEDEPAVLALAERVLHREGYRVLTAESGESAERILDEAPEVDLVVTDVIMPRVSGPELIQRVRNRHPGVRSLFMSGYTADELESRGLDRTEEHFLPKPFTPYDLAQAVRIALG